ncbi:D-alanyl-D-alanine carboxypeptidase family protein [Herbinix luporum]|jgi:D-alanyl-D-alanine carboxypeptidase|uniref:D-alanyl-D-alanine carboxypeptidase family protein n=1 Tax=Herbinix luporum TaxID=1679721 RepID=UPI0023F17A3A|nr:D-alanyl-D-alanine carboxypeptidase family protein [Herbinix luporum]
MKKLILSILCIICISFSCFSVSVSADEKTKPWPKGPSVFAEAAIVMEASTGLILYEKNINNVYYPASITKILSSLLIIENSSPGEVVTFSHDAVFKVDLDSSRIGIDVGEQLTIQQCLYGILLESANEVTYAAAEHVAGSISTFVEMMNERAKSIGCLNTNFTNPHGLPDDNHYTTAYDMALITREAMKNETFRKITSTRTYQIPPTNKQKETRYLRNHHKFIVKNDHKFNYEGTIGGKTGYTNKARFTLVTVAKRGDLELICVVLKDDTNNHQYEDTTKLLDFGFDNFSIYSINELENHEILKESPFFTRYNSILDYSNSLVKTDKKGYLILPNTASFEDAKKEVTFHPDIQLKEGRNIIGRISYTYDGMYVGGADILFDNIKTPTLAHTSLLINEPAQPSSDNEPTLETSEGSLRPIIIGVIVGLFVLIVGLYFIFVERPRIKRRRAYLRKRANRRRYYSNDSYLDL